MHTLDFYVTVSRLGSNCALTKENIFCTIFQNLDILKLLNVFQLKVISLLRNYKDKMVLFQLKVISFLKVHQDSGWFYLN